MDEVVDLVISAVTENPSGDAAEDVAFGGREVFDQVCDDVGGFVGWEVVGVRGVLGYYS